MPKDTRPPIIFEQYYCDNCGNETRWIDRQGEEYFVADGGYSITELKRNIDSANKGESAVLCGECWDWYNDA